AGFGASTPTSAAAGFEAAMGEAAAIILGDARAIPPGPGDGLDRPLSADLRRQEKEIAARFHSSAWVWGVYAVAGFAVWLSFFPLAIMGWLNLAIAFPVSCVLIVSV